MELNTKRRKKTEGTKYLRLGREFQQDRQRFNMNCVQTQNSLDVFHETEWAKPLVSRCTKLVRPNPRSLPAVIPTLERSTKSLPKGSGYKRM